MLLFPLLDPFCFERLRIIEILFAVYRATNQPTNKQKAHDMLFIGPPFPRWKKRTNPALIRIGKWGFGRIKKKKQVGGVCELACCCSSGS